MKVTLEIQDDKVDEVLAIIKKMEFVEVKQEKPLLLQELEEAIAEVKLARAGKIKLQTLDELLDEL